MAKKAPQNNPGFNIRFLFPDKEKGLFPSGYLDSFAEKIRSEHISRTGIYVVADDQVDHPHNLIKNIGEGTDGQSSIDDGYVVILDPRSIERQVNPTEFFRLSLPADPRRKTFYEISFRGKEGSEHGGIIVPSDLVKYIIATQGAEAALDTGLVKNVLRKFGFSMEDRVIHQSPPFSERKKKLSGLFVPSGFNLAWNTTLALKEARTPSLRSLFFTNENPLFRLAFFAMALAIFLIIPILSLDAGLSGDDEKHYQHAAKVFKYFTEDDTAALNDPKHKLNFYGQSFDFFTYLLIRLFGLQEHAYEARHVMVALTGAAAILFTALLVKLFAGYSGGLLALVLMFLSPRFVGHAFNNPMDIPFAFGNIFTLYHIVLFLKKLPRFSARNAIWIAMGIAWTNGIRIGGLLLVPYLFMFSGLYLLIRKWPWKFFSAKWWGFAIRGIAILVAISLAGYLLSLLTWPYALQDIVNHPRKAFEVMSDIQVSIRVLYNGMIHWSDNLPWHYIPKNVLLTVPVLVLLSWFASLITWVLDRKRGNGFWYFMLWFTVLFPVIFIIIRESNVYGGWRHMIFIYPSMVALAALSLSSLIRRAGKKRAVYVTGFVLLAGLLHPAKHMITNHPNTYIYFNEWAGGVNNTYGTFETDFYTNSLKPASDYFIEHILPEAKAEPGQKTKVVSNFNLNYYFRHHREEVTPLYSRYYDRGRYDWDYAILYCNYINPFQLNNGLWPPVNTIHEVKVDDVVVAAIIERMSKDDFHGSTLLKEGAEEQNVEKMSRAIEHLEKAVAYDSTNVAAYLELGNAYTSFMRFEDTRNAMDQLMKVYPDYDKALNVKGYSYLVESEVKREPELTDEGIRYISRAVSNNFKFYSGYYNLGLAYGMKDDMGNAEYYLKLAIRYNSKFKAAYLKLAELYDIKGFPDQAQQVRQAAGRLP